MFPPLLIAQLIVYGFAMWFGQYLLARDASKAGLRYAGFGLVAYALGLALDVLIGADIDPALALTLTRLRWPLLFLPALFWFGATVSLLPDTMPVRARLLALLDYGLVTLLTLLYILAFVTEAPVTGGPIYWLLGVGIGALLLVALYFAWQAYRSGQPKRPLSLALAASLFFGLGMGMILLPTFEWLTPEAALVAIGFDLMLLGVALVALDAFDEGEALLPDFLRSLGFAAFAALLFGGQAVLIMLINERVTPEMLALLLALMTTAIATQTFADPLQNALDRLIFARFPRRGRERATLRAAASAVSRVDDGLDLLRMHDKDFTRLTRRALSHFGDLNRLAASPLTRMPLVDARLDNGDSTLERAAELKAILTDSITRMKPRDGQAFGTSDEWRYYNALYFPYVVGLKPYSRRADYDDLDPVAREALDWFQTYVPERTLYNWQTAAARLVAQDLREQMQIAARAMG